MDTGAWWATVHRVTNSQIQWKQQATQAHNNKCLYTGLPASRDNLWVTLTEVDPKGMS